jgi:hypothetical protein
VRVVLAWLRLDLRRRWRSLAVLALLVAIASGTVMAALAGARRGASALTRLQDRTLPATATVYANEPMFDWGSIRALPEVEALATFVVTYGTALEGFPDGAVSFPPADDAATRTIERPVVFAGRVFDPARPDEAVVTRGFAESYHLGVNDTVVLRLPTPQQVANGEATDRWRLAGPRVTLHIVGVVRSPWLAADAPNSDGILLPSPGLTARYRANLVGGGAGAEYVNAIVRLRGGEAAVATFRQHVANVTGRSNIEVVDLPDQQREAQRASTFEASCLLAFGGAALVAALFLVGPAIVRYTAASATELHTMRALGMTPRQAVAAAAAGVACAGLAGALIGSAGAIVASRWFPLGTAALFESSPGVSVDWTVLGPGLACVMLLVAGVAAVSGWLARGASRPTATSRRSGVASAAARAGLPVPVVIGARFALEPGRGRTSVPVRPALVGAVAGVLGILAAFTFARGVSDAASNPERFGQTFQLISYLGLSDQDFGPASPVYSVLSKSPDVIGLNDAKLAVATAQGGSTSVALYSNTPVGTGTPIVITSGRLPESVDDVMLAPRSASALHARRGDTVTLTGTKDAVKLVVSGIGFVPEGPHNTYADGGWVTPAGYDRLFTGFQYHEALVTLRHGADPAAAAAALTKDVTAAIPEAQGFTFDFAHEPTQVAEIRQVRVLPIVLGFFLALLAVGAVGHALATAVRRRRQDLAVLRALGMTRRQCRWVVVTQATVLAVVGLIFGVPLGLALGRSLWRAVADYTPLQYAPPMAVWALVLVAPAALLLSNLLAAWPGHRAARLRIAHVLRAE